MKTNFLLKFVVCLLVMLLCYSCVTPVFGEGDGRFNFEDFENETAPENVINPGKSVAVTVITTMKIVSIAVAIVILLIISMRYMISAPGDRADIKKHLIPYVIGVIILFSTSGILALIEQLSTAIE